MCPSHAPHVRKPLRLLAFGGASLVDAGGTVVAEQRRRLALLVLIAAGRGQGVSRDKLVAYLSPDSPTESARHALQQLVYYVRQQAGDDAFLGTDPLRLNPAVVTSDVFEFEDAIETGRFGEAVALYRGPFLDGFHLAESVEFDGWASSERARLGALYAEVLRELASGATRAGEHEASVRWHRRLAAIDPLSGTAALGLMRALVAAGDRPGAVRHARTHEAIVRSELGAPMDPEVSSFAAELERSAEHRAGASRPPGPGAEDGTVSAGQLTPRPEDARSPRRMRGRLAMAGLAGAAVTVGVAAVLASRVPPASPDAAPDVVAILPFRTAAADTGLHWLANGLVELLTIRLAGDGGIAVADPAAVFAAWRRDARTTREMSGEAASGFARRVGAGRTIEGSVLGTDAHLVVTASILQAHSRRALAYASAEGPVDSLPDILDRLSAQLLGIAAGVDRDRVASLTSASLPAIRAFLAGRAAFRGGDPDKAARRFVEALAIDSTFALAGLELIRAATWNTPVSDEPGRRAASAWRHRLSQSDQVLLDAMLGGDLSARDMLGKWQAAVARFPGRPETWYGLGDTYFHWGPLLGVEDALRRAEDAFRRGWQLESAGASGAGAATPLVAEPIVHLVELAHMRGDAAEVRRLVGMVMAADSTSGVARSLAWHRAMVDGPDARRAFWDRIGTADQRSLMAIVLFIKWTGVGADDYRIAAAEDMRRLTTNRPGYADFALTSYALTHGRPADVPSRSERAEWGPVQGLRGRVRAALWWDGDTAAAWAAVRALEARGRETGPALRPGFENRCTVAHWRLAHGDFDAAGRASAELRKAVVPGLTGIDSASFANYAHLCAALLDAARASALQVPGARGLIAIADSLAREFVFQVCCDESVSEANLLLARLWEGQSDIQRARRALRRRSGAFMIGPQYLTTFLREEGRLAAITGDTATAVRAYRHYLALRHDPAPALRRGVERIRGDLAALQPAQP